MSRRERFYTVKHAPRSTDSVNHINGVTDADNVPTDGSKAINKRAQLCLDSQLQNCTGASSFISHR